MARIDSIGCKTANYIDDKTTYVDGKTYRWQDYVDGKTE